MAKNLIACGDVFDYTVPANTTINSGDPVLMADIMGAAITSGVTDDVIAVQVEGVFEFPKAAAGSGKAFTQGQKVYFDATAKNMVNTDASGANKHVGWAYVGALTTATTLQVRLLG
jgi:predicted RecA/RadA family phage recombinase